MTQENDLERAQTNGSMSSGAQSQNSASPDQDDSADALVGDAGSRISTKLHERHINMIAISGTIGSGLFINTGEIIKLAGPGGAILAYIFMGLVYLSVVSCLGEMTALMPVRGPIIEFPSRFLDKRVAFAVGWMYWLTYAITVPTQIVSASTLMEFHYSPDARYQWDFGVIIALWILAFFTIIFFINFLPVRVFGEIEWVIGSIKMLVIIALILLMFIIPSGILTPGERIGYRKNWSAPGFFSNNGTVVNGHVYEGGTGRFFSMWSAMNKALFSYIGMEIIAVAAAETKVVEAYDSTAEKEVFKIATRKIYIRIIALYCCSIFAVSFVIPSTDPRLLGLGQRGASFGGQSSPFVIAIIDAGIPTLPHILNGFFVISATSAGVVALYVASRTLHVLAIQGFTPTWAVTTKLKRLTNQSPRPFNAVLFTGPIGLLAFLACKSTPKKVFDALVTISVVCCLIVMAVICLTYICFVNKLEYLRDNPPMGQNNSDLFDRESPSYPYKSRIQPYKAWAGLIICVVMILMNGFRVFLGGTFNAGDFVSSYIGLLLFILLFVGYNIRTKGIRKWPSRILEDFPPNPRRCKASAIRRGTLHYADKSFPRQIQALLYWLWVWCK